MSEIKVIYWDLGGVCVTDNIHSAFQNYNVEYGERQKSAWKELRKGKINSDEFFRKATLGTNLEGKLNEFKEQMTKLIKLQPFGALPVVKSINSLEKYRQGVISNHTMEWVNYMEKMFKIKSYFDKNLLIISEEVGLDKTMSDIFDLAFNLAGVEAENILFIDNDIRNVQKAREKSLKRNGFNAEVFQNASQILQVLKTYGVEIGDNIKQESNLGV